MHYQILLLLLAGITGIIGLDYYQNPIIKNWWQPPGLPDPGVIFDKGVYYMVATSDGHAENVFPIHASTNLVDWKLVGSVFPHNSRPAWTKASYWAPEIHKIGEKYVVYYTARDTTGRLCVGVAWGDSAIGPFSDLGQPMIRDPTVGMIDPTYYFDRESNTHQLIWKLDGNDVGKPTPIFMQQLSDNNFTKLVGEKVQLISNTLEWEGNLVEGPWMIKHNAYYYLFYSANAFYNEKYATGVARSKKLKGPYEKFPLPILHTMPSCGTWVGPGHGSVVPALHDPSQFIFVYHAWFYQEQGGSYCRLPMMDQVHWNETTGWPYLLQGSPSVKPMPVP